MNSLQFPFTVFKGYEEQTKIKHLVFCDYIDKWIKILGKYSKINYIDGYGGKGAYEDKNGVIHYGSPILAAESIERNKNILNREVNLIIIDKNKKNLSNIKKIFDYKKINITPELSNKDFDQTINSILDNIQNSAPTFIFIDPYGFRIKIKTIERIMNIPKSEVFLNFMFQGVNRWLGIQKFENIFDELFGNPKWRDCISLKGSIREKCLVSLYRKELKKIAKFVFFYKLEFPEKKATYYYLIHLTNHVMGCIIMKSIFAKYNHGRLEYRGKRSNQTELFENSENKIFEAINYLKIKYKDKKINYQKILEDNIDNTDFLDSDFRNAIKKMENIDLVVNRIMPFNKNGKLRTSIKPEDIITFNNKC